MATDVFNVCTVNHLEFDTEHKSAYQGFHLDKLIGYGSSLNYQTYYYYERNYVETNLSAAKHMEDEAASQRLRRDLYEFQSLATVRMEFFRSNPTGTGNWHHVGLTPWATDNLFNRKEYEFGKYNRNVIWQYCPDEPGSNYGEFYRDFYFQERYGRDCFRRGNYLYSYERGDPAPSAEERFPMTYRDGAYTPLVGRSHPYHEFPAMMGGGWNQIIMDFHLSMINQEHGMNRRWWITEYPYADNHGDTTHNYFDCNTRIYTYANNESWQSIPQKHKDANFYTSGEKFYVEPYAKDNECTHFIHSLIGGYNPNRGGANGEFYFGFCPYSFAPYDVEVRWSYVDMHAATVPGVSSGFDTEGQIPTDYCHDRNGQPQWPDGHTPAAGVMPRPLWLNNSDGSTWQEYNHPSFWTSEINPTGGTPDADGNYYVYFAARPQEATWDEMDDGHGLDRGDPAHVNRVGPWDPECFRQICIPVQLDLDAPGILPPHLKDII